ncbi:PREDICTED: germinal center-associated signaling and motility-like protein [Chinchilla lanigera]|uniref:germinal center-associated signaling and motility-like protein n=1 Tax=Chinchilla lanigera TaxID=34839 RepID=UPI0006970B3F|nr:PREDICTED: germinal center-associated signaling and motility-like protein [Chinchilla lanigera]
MRQSRCVAAGAALCPRHSGEDSWQQCSATSASSQGGFAPEEKQNIVLGDGHERGWRALGFTKGEDSCLTGDTAARRQRLGDTSEVLQHPSPGAAGQYWATPHTQIASPEPTSPLTDAVHSVPKTHPRVTVNTHPSAERKSVIAEGQEGPAAQGEGVTYWRPFSRSSSVEEPPEVQHRRELVPVAAVGVQEEAEAQMVSSAWGSASFLPAKASVWTRGCAGCRATSGVSGDLRAPAPFFSICCREASDFQEEVTDVCFDFYGQIHRNDYRSFHLLLRRGFVCLEKNSVSARASCLGRDPRPCGSGPWAQPVLRCSDPEQRAARSEGAENMGNAVLRALSCVGKNPRKNRKGNRGVKRRRQEMTTSEGESQGQDGKSKEFPSTSNQEQAEAGDGCEDVCYTVIKHAALRWPSLTSTDHGYENVEAAQQGGRRPREESETEYALLRTAAAAAASCTPEHDYELVLPQ